MVAASWSVRRLISSAVRLFIPRVREEEIAGRLSCVCPINAIEGATKETPARATISPMVDCQLIQVTETQQYFFVHRLIVVA